MAASRVAAPERGSDGGERTGMKPPVVGFAGMTHLGLVSASAVAARGFQTRCFDPDRGLIERLVQQGWPVLEAGLDELIRGNGARQTFPTAAHGLSNLH